MGKGEKEGHALKRGGIKFFFFKEVRNKERGEVMENDEMRKS